MRILLFYINNRQFILHFDELGLCQALDQSLLDNIATSLDLRFDVLNNLIGGCQVRLTFTNKGRRVTSFPGSQQDNFFQDCYIIAKEVLIYFKSITTRETKITAAGGYLLI